MKSKIINQSNQKTFVLIFDTGDEVIKGLKDFAEEYHISAAQFTAIGAFSEVLLGFFDFSIKDYKKIPVSEQVEVLAFTGDVALYKEVPKIHAHVVVGKADGHTLGGHVLKAIVRPTLEVVLTESPAFLKRETDPITGLALITV